MNSIFIVIIHHKHDDDIELLYPVIWICLQFLTRYTFIKIRVQFKPPIYYHIIIISRRKYNIKSIRRIYFLFNQMISIRYLWTNNPWWLPWTHKDKQIYYLVNRKTINFVQGIGTSQRAYLLSGFQRHYIK